MPKLALPLCIASCLWLAACGGEDPTTELVRTVDAATLTADKILHRESQYLGSPEGYAVLYDNLSVELENGTTRGSQRLHIYDQKRQYLGYYPLYQNLKPNASTTLQRTIKLTFENGQTDALDFAAGPPSRSAGGRLLFMPAD